MGVRIVATYRPAKKRSYEKGLHLEYLIKLSAHYPDFSPVHVSLLPLRFPPATVPPDRLLRMFWALVVTLVVNVSMLNLTPSHSQYERLSGIRGPGGMGNF